VRFNLLLPMIAQTNGFDKLIFSEKGKQNGVYSDIRLQIWLENATGSSMPMPSISKACVYRS